MEKCPVCGKENNTLVCEQCGFDGSMNYETHPTIAMVPGLSVSVRKAEYVARKNQYQVCTSCGCAQYYWDPKRMELICTQCGNKQVLPASGGGRSGFFSGIGRQTTSVPQGFAGPTIAIGKSHVVAVKTNGTVLATGFNGNGQCSVSRWRNMISVAAGSSHTVGLRCDGTVMATGSNDSGQCNVSGWNQIIRVAAGTRHTIGLKADGTVVAAGSNHYGQCDVSEWRDIISVAAGEYHTIGLKADGTVVATGSNDSSQCKVSGWSKIIAISASGSHSAGLEAKGTVVATGQYNDGYIEIRSFNDIVAISSGGNCIVGLKANGTIQYLYRYNSYYQRAMDNLREIVAIHVLDGYFMALKQDGAVIQFEDTEHQQCKVSGWKNIKIP